MKKLWMLFLPMFIVCCFVTNIICMEKNFYNKVIRKLMVTRDDELPESVDHFAPEIRKELLRIILAKQEQLARQEPINEKELSKVSLIASAIEDSLSEITKIQYSQKNLIMRLDALVETDRSEVPTKVASLPSDLKEALIQVYDTYLKPDLSKQSDDYEIGRLLNKLEFIKKELLESLYVDTKYKRAHLAKQDTTESKGLSKISSIARAIEGNLSEITKSQYEQNRLIKRLDQLVETDKSEIPEEIAHYTPKLRRALTQVFSKLKPELSKSGDYETKRLLNKLEFINQALEK